MALGLHATREKTQEDGISWFLRVRLRVEHPALEFGDSGNRKFLLKSLAAAWILTVPERDDVKIGVVEADKLSRIKIFCHDRIWMGLRRRGRGSRGSYMCRVILERVGG